MSRDEWLASGRGDLLGDRERSEPPLDKEDLSDMFGRAAFEKMQPTGERHFTIRPDLTSDLMFQRTRGLNTTVTSVAN